MSAAKRESKSLTRVNEWYNLRPVLGHFGGGKMLMAVLLGGREAGKSYSVTNFFVHQYKNRGIPFTWIRLTEKAGRKLLQNNAEKLVDPDIRRKYNLDLVTSGNNVYEVTRRSKPDSNGKTKVLEKKLMARVYWLSTFYNDKGSIFDKDFLNDPKMRYNIAVDEFERESGEKNTFDIVTAFVGQIENLVRSTKERMKLFLLGNTLEECSDILAAFNFFPSEFKIYKLSRRRCVIHNIPITEAYKKRRQGTVASILTPTASAFTNEITADNVQITNKKLIHPQYVIKFTKNKATWFTVWDGDTVAPYCNENKPVIAMRPYLDEPFDTQSQGKVFDMFDAKCYNYKNLVTFKRFQGQLQQLKPRK